MCTLTILFTGQEEDGKEQQKPQPPGQPPAEGDVYFDHLFGAEQESQQQKVHSATHSPPHTFPRHLHFYTPHHHPPPPPPPPPPSLPLSFPAPSYYSLILWLSLSTFPLQPSGTPQPYTPYMPQPERSQRSVSPEAAGVPPPVPLKRSKTTKPLVCLSQLDISLPELSSPPISYLFPSFLPFPFPSFLSLPSFLSPSSLPSPHSFLLHFIFSSLLPFPCPYLLRELLTVLQTLQKLSSENVQSPVPRPRTNTVDRRTRLPSGEQ